MGNYRRSVLVRSFGFVLLVVALGVVSWMSSKNGTAESPETQEVPPPPEVIHPRKDLDTYLGIWMPALYHLDIHSLQDPQDLNRIGANTAAFAMEMAYNEEGLFHERRVDVARPGSAVANRRSRPPRPRSRCVRKCALSCTSEFTQFGSASSRGDCV